MDNKKSDKYYSRLISEDIDKILRYTNDITHEEFISNEQLIDATLFRLIQITENIKKLSSELKENNNHIEWNNIVGFRNRIVHDYGNTDYSIVYEIISCDLKRLKTAVCEIDNENAPE